MKKTILALSCLLLSTSPITYVYAQGGPTPVIVYKVQKQEFNDKIEALGTLKANESVDITVNLTETITKIHFDDGQIVKAGDILVEMTSVEEHAQLNEAIATKNEAESQLNRIESLASKGTASKSTLDERRRQFETAKARLIATESKLKDLIIAAPFDGVLGLRNISDGALVRPGDLITTLDDVSIMKLDFQVPSVFLPALSVGQDISAKADAFKNEKFTGQVYSISSQVDPITRSVTVRAKIPNPDHKLRPGLLMSVELIKDPRQSIVIPEEALVPEGRKNYVYVTDVESKEPKAIKTEIEIGGRRKGDLEVLSGIKEGDHVITHGTIRVRPNGAVTIKAIETDETSIEDIIKKKDPS